MISLNGLYTTLRNAIQELTGVEVYQNTSHSYKVVDAKWLFVKVVYYLFELNEGIIVNLTRPIYENLARELNYSSAEGIYALRKRSFTEDTNLEWKLELLKAVFKGYINNTINKQDIIPIIQFNKAILWASKYYKITINETI